MLMTFAAIVSMLNDSVSLLKRVKLDDDRHRCSFDYDERAIEQHLTYVKNWSDELRIAGGDRRVALEDVYVRLRLQQGQMRARRRTAASQEIYHDSLPENGQHKVILGGPGAGKTTTLRYLAQSILSSSELNKLDLLDFPVLIECRTLRNRETITQRLTNVLGLRVSGQRMERRHPTPIWVEDAGYTERCAFTYVLDILQTRAVLILVDGLDEVSVHKRSDLIRELDELALHMDRSCLIVTCRFGALLKPIENCEVYAVQDLSPDEMSVFVAKWFPDQEDQRGMQTELARADFAQLAATPLHLANLCLIYEAIKKLPETRLTVYEQIVDLRLYAWDQRRGIDRVSKYGRQFQPKEKRRFLSALAFQMGVDRTGHRFNRKQLRSAYERVAARLKNLPPDEADEVATELESHTGIIVQSGYGQFEFYHLSIYEYLCAEYISRMQINDLTVSTLSGFPESCAMAMELASQSDQFLLHLVTRMSLRTDQANVVQVADFWVRFLTRASSERVIVELSRYSGLALLSLMCSEWISTGVPEKDRKLHQLSPVVDKAWAWCQELGADDFLRQAFELFQTANQGRHCIVLQPKQRWPAEIRYRPKCLNIRTKLYDWIRSVPRPPATDHLLE